MTVPSDLVLQLSGRLAAAFAADVLDGALVLLLVGLLLRLLPNPGAATRSVVWTGVLIVVAAMPFLPSGMARSAAQTLPQASHALRFAPVWSLGVVFVWLVASAVRAIGLVAGAWRLRRISLSAVPVPTLEGGGVQSVRSAGGFVRSARLCVSSAVGRPSVIGFFSPRVLIPAALYPRLSACERDHIFRHEMEHLRRLDDWRNLGQKLALVVFPLNPALLWLDRRLGMERELACDESVLEATRAPKAYASCLVHLAEESAIGRHLSLALGAWERRSELARRVHGILGYRFGEGTGRGHGRNRMGAVALVSASLVLGATLAHAPQLITFAAPAPVTSASAPGVFTLPLRADYTPVALRPGGGGSPHVVEAVAHMPAHARPVRQRQPGSGLKRTTRNLRLRRAVASRGTVRGFALTSWSVAFVAFDRGPHDENASARPQLTFTVFDPSTRSLRPLTAPQAFIHVAIPTGMTSSFIVFQL